MKEKYNRTPTFKEVANYMDIAKTKTLKNKLLEIELQTNIQSLDEGIGPNETPFVNLIPFERNSPENEYIEMETEEIIRNEIINLPKRQRDCLVRYIDLAGNGENKMSIKKIAAELNITRQAVYNNIEKALQQIMKRLGGFEFLY